MATMNISLPDELKQFVDEQVNAHGYVSSSEYVRELIRKQRDIAHVRALLLEGANSGPGCMLNEDCHAELRDIALGKTDA